MKSENERVLVVLKPIDRYPVGSIVTKVYTDKVADELIDAGYLDEVKPLQTESQPAIVKKPPKKKEPMSAKVEREVGNG